MKIEKPFQPIRVESVEEHERILKDKLLDIELEYVDQIFLKKIPTLDKEVNVDDITKLIPEYTQILSDIREYVNWGKNKEKILKNISDFYHQDYEHWIEKTKELIKKEVEELKKDEKIEGDHEENKNIAGLIDFSMESNKGHLLPGSDITDNDPCLEVHFESFYKQKGDNKTNLLSVRDSFNKIALEIVDKHPETKAVVGVSWLMDALGENFGFKIYNRNFNKNLQGQFWPQFIDKDGQIKNEEVSKFLETGEPPYRVAAGAMMTEDFLKKYLPKERRGKIVLKELNLEISNEIKKESVLVKALFENWEKTTEEDIEKVIYGCRILNEFTKTELGKGFIQHLKDFKHNGESLDKLKTDTISKAYIEVLNKFIDNLRYLNKEVTIE